MNQEEEEKRVSDDYNERKLKEEIDRYEQQNQEAYDKEVSGENFLKERAQKAEEEEEDPDAGDLAKGIGFEIAAVCLKALPSSSNPFFFSSSCFLRSSSLPLVTSS